MNSMNDHESEYDFTYPSPGFESIFIHHVSSPLNVPFNISEYTYSFTESG